jgi:hypothetical protein
VLATGSSVSEETAPAPTERSRTKGAVKRKTTILFPEFEYQILSGVATYIRLFITFLFATLQQLHYIAPNGRTTDEFKGSGRKR